MDLTVFAKARDEAKQRLGEIEAEIKDLEVQRLNLQATVSALDELLTEDYEATYSDLTGTLSAARALAEANSVGTAIKQQWSEFLDPLHSLTDSCRQIIRIVPNTGMQVSEIVRLLEERGLNVKRYLNPVSAVKTVLVRLIKSGDVRVAGRTAGGRPLYAPTERQALASPSMLVGIVPKEK